jgi:hypothetical protein
VRDRAKGEEIFYLNDNLISLRRPADDICCRPRGSNIFIFTARWFYGHLLRQQTMHVTWITTRVFEHHHLSSRDGEAVKINIIVQHERAKRDDEWRWICRRPPRKVWVMGFGRVRRTRLCRYPPRDVTTHPTKIL